MTRNYFLNHDPKRPPDSGDPCWIFLTPTQAVDAVAMDFQAYGPQPELLRRIAPLVLGPQCRTALSEENRNGVTVWRGASFEPVQDHSLGFYLIHVMETAPPDLNTLAHICRRVFQTTTFAGKLTADDEPGIWVHSQMDGFVCRQCGQCCRQLDYETGCDESDIRLWQDRGRTDILAWVQYLDTPGESVDRAYRIWVDPDTGKPPGPARGLGPVRIIRTGLCAPFTPSSPRLPAIPYTAKHAAMTGCSGRFAAQTEPPVHTNP